MTGDDERDESADRGFTVVDRRGREAETPEPGPAEPERDPGGAGGAPSGGRVSDEAPEPGGAAGAGRDFTLVDEPGSGPEQGGGEVPLPPVDFSGLALSLATSALYHLGLVADPESGEPGRVDLRLARHTIDTLELLETKTQGNLTEEESTLLANLLTELRMRFVEARDGA